jgi:hypothetical protein
LGLLRVRVQAPGRPIQSLRGQVQAPDVASSALKEPVLAPGLLALALGGPVMTPISSLNIDGELSYRTCLQVRVHTLCYLLKFIQPVLSLIDVSSPLSTPSPSARKPIPETKESQTRTGQTISTVLKSQLSRWRNPTTPEQSAIWLH